MEEADDDEEAQLYAWEGTYERPWEAVREAADGSLVRHGGSSNDTTRAVLQTGVKRGMLRAVYVVLDGSRASTIPDPDMRPSRLSVMADIASEFVAGFFEQNPISTLAVLVTRNGRAEYVTEPSCNARQHLEALKRLGTESGVGDASLQNALELARESLQSVPSFTAREVVIISASLSSCDPGDILATLGAVKSDRLRVSVFCLAAEVFICRRIASDTGGEFGVPRSIGQLRSLVLSLVPPRPTSAQGSAAPANALIKVGFPRRAERAARPTLAFSSSGGPTPQISENVYRCPQCNGAHTELPTQCVICGIKLMSSVDLTRTYHHLFPPPAFTDATRVVATDAGAGAGAAGAGGGSAGLGVSSVVASHAHGWPPDGFCFGCGEKLPMAPGLADDASEECRATGFECPGCKCIFCTSCDDLVHTTLRTCPGCSLRPV
jgi:transcription initiation factor TFIIH subunit 2